MSVNAFQLNPAPVTVITNLPHSNGNSDNPVEIQIYCSLHKKFTW